MNVAPPDLEANPRLGRQAREAEIIEALRDMNEEVPSQPSYHSTGEVSAKT